MKKKFIAGFIIALALGACSKKNEQRIRLPSGQILNIPISAEIRSLEPSISNDYPAGLIIKMLFDGLMRVGPDGNLSKGVAENYEISEDKKTYTFYLRSSVWSNGDPVTAYDFEYAWKKAIDPSYPKTGAFTFYVIKNATACFEKKKNIDEVGIKAINEKTLVVELEHPAPYFLSLTTCSTYAPISKKLDLERPDWTYSRDENFVSNGPFCLKKWQKGDYIKLKKNTAYWDNTEVVLNEIRILIIPDATTRFYMFEKGELDWVGTPFGSIALDLLIGLNEENKLQNIEALGLNWLFINTEKYPFNNKNLRKALASGIDRKAIVEHILHGGEKIATGVVNSKFMLQKEPYFEDGNSALAKQYFNTALDELGITADEFPPIHISIETSEFSSRLIQVIQQQWQQIFGIKVNLIRSEWAVFFNNIASGNFAIGLMAWYSWINDPIYILNTFREKKLATNISRWENPLYKQYLDQSDNEIDPVARMKCFGDAEALLMDEMPVIPIHYKTLSYVINPYLKNYCATPLFEVDFKYAYFNEDK